MYQDEIKMFLVFFKWECSNKMRFRQTLMLCCLSLQISQRSSRTAHTLHRMTGRVTTLISHPTPQMRGWERSPGELILSWSIQLHLKHFSDFIICMLIYSRKIRIMQDYAALCLIRVNQFHHIKSKELEFPGIDKSFFQSFLLFCWASDRKLCGWGLEVVEVWHATAKLAVKQNDDT